MIKGGEGAARRYARALVDLAAERKDEALVRDLGDLARAFAESAELHTVLVHPSVPTEKKVAVVKALGGKSDLLLKLVALLVDRDRIELLPLIAKSYVRQWNAARGVVEAEAVSASALDETERRTIAAGVEKALGKTVELTPVVDPAVVGGVLLRVEGRVYDGTVRGRLKALRATLTGVEG